MDTPPYGCFISRLAGSLLRLWVRTPPLPVPSSSSFLFLPVPVPSRSSALPFLTRSFRCLLPTGAGARFLCLPLPDGGVGRHARTRKNTQEHSRTRKNKSKNKHKKKSKSKNSNKHKKKSKHKHKKRSKHKHTVLVLGKKKSTNKYEKLHFFFVRGYSRRLSLP